MSDKWKDYPASPCGRYRVVGELPVPHPYMIGPKHVEVASDRFSSMLGAEAIEFCEKNGRGCYWKGCSLKYREHEQALMVAGTPKGVKNLNDVEGIKDYLLSIKGKCESDGYCGFAFV